MRDSLDDERPPICPACGVTTGITVDDDGTVRAVCLECGFSDDEPVSASAVRGRYETDPRGQRREVP